jgi:hypothetical protein
MLIANTTFQPKDFPMLCSQNMLDCAQALKQCNAISVAAFTWISLFLVDYNLTTMIDYKTYNMLMFLFDIFIGLTPTENIIISV